MNLTEADTPLCNALESNALDSFDLRAWKSLARRLERDLAQIRAQGQKPVCELPDGVPLYAAPLVPQGMVLVPVEPTKEMLESALDAFRGFPVGRPSLVGCYKAMLAAAQGGKNG